MNLGITTLSCIAWKIGYQTLIVLKDWLSEITRKKGKIGKASIHNQISSIDWYTILKSLGSGVHVLWKNIILTNVEFIWYDLFINNNIVKL